MHFLDLVLMARAREANRVIYVIAGLAWLLAVINVVSGLKNKEVLKVNALFGDIKTIKRVTNPIYFAVLFAIYGLIAVSPLILGSVYIVGSYQDRLRRAESERTTTSTPAQGDPVEMHNDPEPSH